MSTMHVGSPTPSTSREHNVRASAAPSPPPPLASATQIEQLQITDDNNLTNPNADHVTGYKLVLLMVALCSALVGTGLDTSIIATILPQLTNQFHTITDIGWYSGAFRLTACSFQFAYGKLYTVFPIKAVYMSCVAVFAVGSVLTATANHSKAFIVGRALCGLGAAGIYAGCYATIGRVIPLPKRPVFTSIGAAVEGVSEIAGPLLGGFLTDALSWRLCFYLNLPIALISIVLVYFYLPSPKIPADIQALSWRAKVQRLDLPGTAIFVPGVTCLLLALQWGGTKFGWVSAPILVLFVLFAVLFGAFAYHQYRRQDEAVIPPRILKSRSVLGCIWFVFNMNASVTVIGYYMPIYFQTVHGASATRSGILFLPVLVGFIMGCLISGSAVPIVGYYSVLAGISSILSPISAGLLTTLNATTSIKALIGFQAFFGIACGLGFQIPQIAMQATLKPEDIAIGISIVLFAQALAPGIFNFVAQNVFITNLADMLQRDVPGFNISTLDNLGLADLKGNLDVIGATSPAQMNAILNDYSYSLTRTFIIPTVMTSMICAGALMMGWKSVKTKRE